MTATMNLPETIRLVDVTSLLATKGWHTDPWQEHDLRYHDGKVWTDHVTHFGPVPCMGCHHAAH
jgi:hypothetical protein